MFLCQSGAHFSDSYREEIMYNVARIGITGSRRDSFRVPTYLAEIEILGPSSAVRITARGGSEDEAYLNLRAVVQDVSCEMGKLLRGPVDCTRRKDEDY